MILNYEHNPVLHLHHFDLHFLALSNTCHEILCILISLLRLLLFFLFLLIIIVLLCWFYGALFRYHPLLGISIFIVDFSNPNKPLPFLIRHFCFYMFSPILACFCWRLHLSFQYWIFFIMGVCASAMKWSFLLERVWIYCLWWSELRQ